MNPVTTQPNRGTIRHGDLYPGSLADIKGSAFVNSRSRGQSEIQAAVRDFSGGIRQTDVVQKEFNV
jgi:hypothetical protein